MTVLAKDLSVPIIPCPNYHVRAIQVVNATFLTLAWAVVVLRVFTRSFVIRAWGGDDYLIICVLLLYTVYCVSVMVLCLMEIGKYSLSFDLMSEVVNVIEPFLTYTLVLLTWLHIVAEVFYCMTLICLKLSLGIFLLQIMVSQVQRRIVYFIVSVSTLWGLVYFFLAVFQCGVPIQGANYWVKFVSRQCASNATVLGMGYTHALITAFTDLAFTTLPIDLLWRAKMSLQRKLLVGLILVIGAIGGIASLIRINYIKNLINPELDFFAKILNLAMWSAIEPGLGIIAASLATLRPLARTVSQAYTSWKSSIRNNHTANTGCNTIKRTAVSATSRYPQQKAKHHTISDMDDTLVTGFDEHDEMSYNMDEFKPPMNFLETQTPTVDLIGHKTKKGSWWRFRHSSLD